MRSLLERLLAAIAGDCSAAWRAIAAQGAGLAVAVRIDREAFVLEVGERGAVVSDDLGAPRPQKADRAGVRLECDGATLRAVVAGDHALLSAVRDQRLRIYGASAELVRLDELVRLLIAGAARSPSAAPLYDELFTKTTSTEPRHE